MRVLCVGGCGYVGAQLVPKLLDDGHHVTVYDTKWFGYGHLPEHPNFEFIEGDIRDRFKLIDAAAGKDAIIWLASISNNAMYGVNYKTTHEVNTCVEYLPCEKFIYASSVAVLDPTSDYAKDKLACEKALAGTGAIIVRAASACGYSPHMRFDLTINKMVHDAYRTGVITVNGGKQRRWHIHIDDLCDFYRLALTKAKDGETYTVWNIGLSVAGAAETMTWVFERERLPIRLEFQPIDNTRDYPELSGESMTNIGFNANRAVWDGARDIIAKFKAGCWPDSQTNAIYQNIATGLR